MPDQQPIYVNGKLFLGRVEEQKQFRAILQDTLALPKGEELPYIVLLYGDGGMGKTTLAQRFCDIATAEPPYEGEFATLWLDWEEERRRHPALQVGREFISPETVFDRLHATLLRSDNGWGRQFSAYQKLVDQRDEIEKKAAEILTSDGDNNDLVHTLRGASTAALAKIIRWQVPIGDTGEKLTQQFLEAGVTVAAGQAANLRQNMETRLQARLKPEQYRLYLNPYEQLALALGDGLKKVAGRKPLILFLDTYEIVDRADDWLREVIKAAGPRLVWVIGGRRNLLSNRQDGPDYFRGYGDAFPRRLLAYDMRQLALADVAAYFADAAPERPLSEVETAAISQATRGIPLAIKTAGEIWQKGVSLEKLVGDLTSATPHQEIVGQMTARYLLHVVDDTDREAIYALALARGDLDVLRLMLQPVVDEPFDLTPRLARLRRDYAAVHLEEARLHDEPAAFITASLRQAERRSSPPIQRMNERAVIALEYRLAALEAELPLLEERCEDEDWVKAAVDMARYLFWLDEQRGWQWLIPRFVEGLAYSRDLRRGLLDVAVEWQTYFSLRSKRRLKKLQGDKAAAASDPLTKLEELLGRASNEADADMLQELSDLARPEVGWLKGHDEVERKAILEWHKGKLGYRQKQYKHALHHYENALKGLPRNGTVWQKELASDLNNLGKQFIWPKDASSSTPSKDGLKATELAVELDGKNGYILYNHAVALDDLGHKEKAVAYYIESLAIEDRAARYNGLGKVYRSLARYPEAIAAYQKALDLDPNYAVAYNNRGLTYRDLGQHQAALADFGRAIDLNLDSAAAYNNRGTTYSALGQHEAALADYGRAIDLNPDYAVAYNNRGTTYSALGQHEAALADYGRAIDLNPDYAVAYNNRGTTYSALGQHEAALADYGRAIDLNPDYAVAYNNRGNTYRDLGQHEAALADFQKAIDLDPNDAVTRGSLAGLYRKLGQEAEYEAQVKIARELIDQESEYNRACFEAICGNVPEAIALLEQAIAKTPHNRVLARTDPDFDFIRDDPRFQALVGTAVS